MRKTAFALLLLAASSAAAQVVGSIEQSYGPYSRDPTNAYLGLAASRDRILLAWSEAEAGRSRIRIGLLDFDGRLVAPIETISTLESDYAFAPIVASDGSGFAVLYSELERPARLVRATVDATGHLIGSPQRFLSTVNLADNVPLFWDGTSYVAYVEGFPMAFAADGTRAATAFGPIDPFATLILENGTLAVAWWRRQVIWGRCHPMWFCEVIGYTVDLDWVVGNRGDTYRPRVSPLLSEGVPPRPFVGTSGTKTLIAWVNEGIHYYVVDNAPREIATALNADPNQRLAIACDAKLCLLAYGTTSGDVYALALDVSRPDDPRVLPVATSGRKEWHPQILKLKEGRFLIAYLSDLPGDLRFAGRIVTVPPSRTRSAGK
jgi:hypothetical protein